MHPNYQQIFTPRSRFMALGALAVLPLMTYSPLSVPAFALRVEEGTTQGKNTGAGTARIDAAEQKRLNRELEKALEEGTANEVKALLAQGADPNGRTQIEAPFVQRAVILACGQKPEAMAKLTVLLEKGADPNRGPGSFLPLHTAAMLEGVGVMEALLERGADIETTTADGNTALHVVAALGKATSARLLIARGASVDARNKKGQTPLQIAEKSGNEAVAETLRNADAIRREAEPVRKPGRAQATPAAANVTGESPSTNGPSDRPRVPARAPLAASGRKPVPVSQSQLTGSRLAAGAQALGTEEQLASAGANLNRVARKYGLDSDVENGFVELIAWVGSSGAPRTALNRELEAAGYARTDYDPVKSGNNRITFFKLVNSQRENETLFGMWVEDSKALLIAWGRLGVREPSDSHRKAREGDILPEEKSAPAEESVRKPARPAGDHAAGGAITLGVDAKTSLLNVMGRTLPSLPTFPAATRKPNMVCGYVYDAKGKPVRGAVIGVRSTAVGGFYSGASGKTDAKGYYEVQAPWGVAHFYCAGAVIDYGEGIAALGLHPADGETGNFVPTQGEVKNFVLLTYGIADRAAVQDNPEYPGNYYGGALSLGWRVGDSSASLPSELPANSEIELTLTPDGPLADGSRGRTIVIRKQVGVISFGQLYVNNIPVGTYKLTAKLANGGALHIKETGPYGNRPFGLEPKEGNGETKLSFRPGSARAEMAIAGHGNWERIDITLSKP